MYVKFHMAPYYCYLNIVCGMVKSVHVGELKHLCQHFNKLSNLLTRGMYAIKTIQCV